MVEKKQIGVAQDLLNMEQICQFVLCVFLCVKYMTVVEGKKSAPPACVCVCREAELELGTAVLLSASGLSEKEFEVEGLRSPLRPHPCSQISCLTAHNCASLRLLESY